jgi:hypothetical protein
MGKGKSMNEVRRVTPAGDGPRSLHKSGRAADMSNELPRIITKRELRLIVPYSPQHILRLKNGEGFRNAYN